MSDFPTATPVPAGTYAYACGCIDVPVQHDAGLVRVFGRFKVKMG